ncbi:MAG: cbb3-type cytochrome oxidase assembly protein CcoS [Tropicimonas sp.]|uniref:cbb3-type cytochrome oxidase assembly protein CcoS n=1 Tax=Tropicimonas sp. TaxID=2067044 RepID=UPI003A8B7DAC
MSLGVLIPLSLGLGLIGLIAFFWALRDGQFDDPDGAAWRVISSEKASGPQDTQCCDDTTPGT